MNAALIILRVCVAPLQQQLRRSSSSVAAALQPSTQITNGRLIVSSLLEVLPAVPREGLRWHLEEGREMLLPRSISYAAAAQQLRRSMSSRRRQCPATMSGRWGLFFGKSTGAFLVELSHHHKAKASLEASIVVIDSNFLAYIGMCSV